MAGCIWKSAHIAVDPLDNDIVYGGSYGGYLTRLNHKNNSERGINVWHMGYGADIKFISVTHLIMFIYQKTRDKAF